jgi:hypothetical protein
MRAMRAHVMRVITLRRDVAAHYARVTRAWVAAHGLYRRLHAAPVKNFSALRQAAQRLDKLGRGRAALLSDLKALSD